MLVDSFYLITINLPNLTVSKLENIMMNMDAPNSQLKNLRIVYFPDS